MESTAGHMFWVVGSILTTIIRPFEEEWNSARAEPENYSPWVPMST